MNKAFNEIMQGLTEAVQYENSNLKAHTNKVTVTPIAAFSPEQIRKLRLSLKLSQSVFSNVLGVSQKTVEAWESGRNIPNGSALRMMGCLEKDPAFVNNFIQMT